MPGAAIRPVVRVDPPVQERRRQRDREDADYSSSDVFTVFEAGGMIAGAEQFLEDVKRILAVR